MWIFLLGCTGEAQPVDAGYGRLLKMEVRKELELFPDQNGNIDKWETISASERRDLIARWVANTAERTDARPGYHLRLFEKTGLAMTADGSRDDRITLEGVSGPDNFTDGATTNNEDAKLEGDSGLNDENDPDSDNDSKCRSDDELNDEKSEESNGETTMMW